jgi:transcriptional regulator PpsR
VTGFLKPSEAIGPVAAETAAELVAAAADLALVLDPEGTVQDVAFQNESLVADLGDRQRWVGRRWADLVTVESKPKIAAMLRDSDTLAATRWRQVNHPAASGPDVPVLYRAVRAGAGARGRIVAYGRDLRSVSALQQRLMDAQQAMERDYARLRSVETRYRLLFQYAREAVLIVDAAALKIVEANPAAERVFAGTVKRLVGRNFADMFDAAGAKTLADLFAGIRASGRSDEAAARLAAGGPEIRVAAIFRQEGTTLLLVRIVAPQAEDGRPASASSDEASHARLLENAPDAFVTCDPAGRVLYANAAFLDLAQVATIEQARAGTLDQWLGRDGVDFNVLIANLRQRGSVRLFGTTLRGEMGAQTDVEVSAVSAMRGGEPEFSFAVRNVAGRVRVEPPRGARELPRSVEQLTELVGRVSLKELVRETTDMIERLCIEAALELTRDNRASAAEMLGLSRQSLYVKLRRYGLTDAAVDGETSE